MLPNCHDIVSPLATWTFKEGKAVGKREGRGGGESEEEKGGKKRRKVKEEGAYWCDIFPNYFVWGA